MVPRFTRSQPWTIGRSALCVAWLLVCSASWAQTELDYQNRGNRYEGLKAKPVSGYDLELISVLAEPSEDLPTLPPALTIRFYLERDAPVFVTVRELDYRHFYWLDHVTPSAPWAKGYDNLFTWKTQPVLQRLRPKIDVDQLGVLARIGSPNPRSKETVAPVILYGDRPPSRIEGYRFTLKPNGDARITCKVYPEGATTPIWKRSFPRRLGGRPFTVTWDARQAQPGAYRFVASGYFLSTNARLMQSIRFWHQPDVR